MKKPALFFALLSFLFLILFATEFHPFWKKLEKIQNNVLLTPQLKIETTAALYINTIYPTLNHALLAFVCLSFTFALSTHSNNKQTTRIIASFFSLSLFSLAAGFFLYSEHLAGLLSNVDKFSLAWKVTAIKLSSIIAALIPGRFAYRQLEPLIFPK